MSPSEGNDFDDRYDSIYNHGYGEPWGTQGINCFHRLFPFVPGVSINHQPQYDPDEAIKNGKIVQQQRARERAIRDAKHRLAVAEELGDEKMINQTKTLIRARQAKMREFIKSTNHGRKVQLLHRDYSREKIVNRPRRDFMAKKHEFTFPSNDGKVLHVHTSQIRNARANMWSEGRTQKYRSAALRVDHALRAYKTVQLPKVVITDSRKLGRSAIASYDHVNDALFVNSDILQDGASTSRYLKDDQFAARSVDDIMKHEMAHKFNWDKAKNEYRLHPDKYKDVDDAINTLNAKVMAYVKNVAFTDPMFLSHSKYLRDAFLRGNSREVVAELNVLKLQDPTLNKLIREVLN